MARIKTLKPRLQGIPHRLHAVTPQSWRSGKTSSERGYDYKWQKARAAYLLKHPLCVMCDALGLTVLATVIDHREPHRGHQTLFWDQSNWQSLCVTCHSSAKQRAEREPV